MIVEAQRCVSCGDSDDALKERILDFLKTQQAVHDGQGYIDIASTPLKGFIEKLHIEKRSQSVGNNNVTIYIYSLNTDGIGNEALDSDESSLNAAQVVTVPCVQYDGMWENLHFDSEVKQNLIDYANKALLFADKGVDHNIICCNKLVLLHGPPGTGKTSLCKGIAQKLSIRWRNRFAYSHFVEINAHSLFSKYFSESGKLVLRMFEKIIEIAEDDKSLVFLLIDEVESLAHSRAAAASGNEPSDSIRVVNALLTQLDRLKLFPNVLVLTTSNVETSIDGAFVDRADICVYIGHPSPAAISKILASCVHELVKKGLLENVPFSEGSEYGMLWNEICRIAIGVSCRSLRRLPLLAYIANEYKMEPFLKSLLKATKAKSVSEKNLASAAQMFHSISLV